jgi:hypothetical protein
MGIEGYTFEGAPKSSPRPKPRPKTIPRPKPRPTTRIGGMPGGSTRGIDPKDNYSPEDLKRLLMQSAMLEMEEAEEEGMIVYVGDQKFEYADYTIQDAMRIVDEYADEMEGEPYEVYNADGELVASGTMRSGAFHEPGIEEGYSPGDENEEGMVSNCCGAPIMDVYDGHGRCSDCKEMASAVPDNEDLDRIKELAGASIDETYDDDDDFYEAYGEMWYNEDEIMDEAEYQGRKVKLGKPMQGDVKKFKVYVKDPKTGNVKKVNFGHGGSSVKGKAMSIKKSNPKRRKSFRARHNCDNPGPRTKARYWSCRKW